MDFGGVQAFSSAIYPGFVQGQRDQVGLDQERESLAQSKLKTQETRDTQEGVAALASIFGVAAPIPPNTPPPMAPGQPSQPSAATAMPDVSAPPPPPTASPGAPSAGGSPPPSAAPVPVPPNPGAVALGPPGNGAPPQTMPPAAPSPGAIALGPPPPGSPPSAPPPVAPAQAAPTAVRPAAPNAPSQAAPPAAAGATPRGGAPTPAQTAALAYGRMTYDDIAQRIRARNPGISPGAFAKAMQAAVPFMNAESKLEFQALSLQQKIDAANQRFELGEKSLDAKRQLAEQANTFRLQIAELQQRSQDSRLTQTLTAALGRTLANLEGRASEGDKNRGAKASEGDKNRGAKASEGDKNRRQQVIRDLGKTGAEFDPAAPLEDLEKQLGPAKQAQEKRAGDLKIKLNQGYQPSEEEYKFLGQQLAAGDTTALQGWGYGKGSAEVRGKIRDQAMQTWKAQNPEATGASAAAAKAGYTAQISAVRTLGQREGALAGTVAEIAPLGKIALDLSNKIDRTKYPSLNAMEQAVKKGTGDPNIVRFIEANNALATAYAATKSRTGATTVSAMKQANDILSTNYAKGQYAAGVDQLAIEAKTILGAQSSARKSITNEIAGGKGSEAPPAEAATPDDTEIQNYDENGNLIEK